MPHFTLHGNYEEVVKEKCKVLLRIVIRERAQSIA